MNFTLNEVRDKIKSLEVELLKANLVKVEKLVDEDSIPKPSEIELFANRARAFLLKGLSFEEKRAIVISVVEKIVAGRTELMVYGTIPVPTLEISVHDNIIISPFYSLRAIHRNCRSAECGEVHAF